MVVLQQSYKFNDSFLKLKFKKDRVFLHLIKILPKNITPNKVTLFRFLTTFVWLPFAVLKPTLNQIFIFFIPNIILDMLDGAIARIKKQETYFGKYFDLFSDRINTSVFFLVVMDLNNYALLTLKIFFWWELFLAGFAYIEYLFNNEKLTLSRQFIQHCIYVILILMFILKI